jgi:hypothetical protein
VIEKETREAFARAGEERRGQNSRDGKPHRARIYPHARSRDGNLPKIATSSAKLLEGGISCFAKKNKDGKLI